MGKGERTSIDRLQRKLVIPNILLCLISLVALLSLLFLPLLRIDLGGIVGSMVEQAGEETGAEEAADVMGDIFDGMDVSVTTVGVAKFGFAKDPTDILTQSFAKVFEKSADSIVANIAVAAVADSVDLDAYGVTDEKLEKVDNAAVTKALQKLEKADAAEKDEAISAFVRTIAEEMGMENVSDDTYAEMESTVGDFYDGVAEEAGSFSLEAFMCMAMSESSGTTVTSYEEFAGQMIGGEGNPFGEIMGKMSGYVKYLAIVLLVFCGVWGLLALLSFLHIFLHNKRVMLWYVKIFGVVPCLLFGVLPLVLRLVMKNVLKDAAGPIVAMLAGISTMTWISGGCWLAVILLSLIRIGPIKRRIKRQSKME